MSTTISDLQNDVERARRRYERTKSRTDLQEFADLRKQLFQASDVLKQDIPPHSTNKS